MAYGYIAKLNKNVERKHTRYNNRFGIAIAADLYTTKELDRTKKYPALIVGAPYGGVKEQGPCVYANELAQRGFIVLTFDQVFMGAYLHRNCFQRAFPPQWIIWEQSCRLLTVKKSA